MQSIIVYRNPLEAMLWESIMTGGFLAFMIPAVLGIIVARMLDRPLQKRYNWRTKRNPNMKHYIQYACIAAGIIGGLAAVWYL